MEPTITPFSFPRYAAHLESLRSGGWRRGFGRDGDAWPSKLPRVAGLVSVNSSPNVTCRGRVGSCCLCRCCDGCSFGSLVHGFCSRFLGRTAAMVSSGLRRLHVATSDGPLVRSIAMEFKPDALWARERVVCKDGQSTIGGHGRVEGRWVGPGSQSYIAHENGHADELACLAKMTLEAANWWAQEGRDLRLANQECGTAPQGYDVHERSESLYSEVPQGAGAARGGEQNRIAPRGRKLCAWEGGHLALVGCSHSLQLPVRLPAGLCAYRMRSW